MQGREHTDRFERVLRKYAAAELLVIDDFASLEMALKAGQAFQGPKNVTTIAPRPRNSRPFKDWAKVFPDPLNAQVVVERLAERSEHPVLA